MKWFECKNYQSFMLILVFPTVIHTGAEMYFQTLVLVIRNKWENYFICEWHKFCEGIKQIWIFFLHSTEAVRHFKCIVTKSNLSCHCLNPWQDDFCNLMVFAYAKSVTQYINTSMSWVVVMSLHTCTNTMCSIKTSIQLENNANNNNKNKTLKQEQNISIWVSLLRKPIAKFRFSQFRIFWRRKLVKNNGISLKRISREKILKW